MPISPHRYQTLVWGDERLNDIRRLILLRISFEGVGSTDRHGWIEISQPDIAAAIHRRRETVARNLAWLVAQGYLRRQQPTVAGNYLKAQYRLVGDAFTPADSTESRVTPESHTDPPVEGGSRVTLAPHGRVIQESHYEGRSPSNGFRDDAPFSGGVAGDGKGADQEPAHTVPLPRAASGPRGAELVRAALLDAADPPTDPDPNRQVVLDDPARQPRNPLQVRCPDCYAPVGRRCRTPAGTPHWSRRDLAAPAAHQTGTAHA